MKALEIQEGLVNSLFSILSLVMKMALNRLEIQGEGNNELTLFKIMLNK
jgi:hypothetical protein